MAAEIETKMIKYWVALPTYCEAENLPLMLERLRRVEIPGGQLDILVIDDNSPDGTGDIAEEFSRSDSRIHVLRRKGKGGLGSAYMAGFARALEAGADVVVTMDCDFSHEPEALPELAAALDGVGCVIGSRYIPGGRIENWPKRRKILSAVANQFVRALFVMPVRDCTTGYRLYRCEVIRDILAVGQRSQGYSFQVEALRVAATGPYGVREHPIRFVERVRGDSKMGIREVLPGAWNLAVLRAKLLFGGRSDDPERNS